MCSAGAGAPAEVLLRCRLLTPARVWLLCQAPAFSLPEDKDVNSVLWGRSFLTSVSISSVGSLDRKERDVKPRKP